MLNLAQKIIYWIMSIQEFALRKKLNGNFRTTYSNSTSKVSFKGGNTLILTTETQKNKDKLDVCVKSLLKKYGNSPDKLLDFVQAHGTDVCKIPHANLLLNIIGEDEGLISECNGLKALYLNIITNSGFSCKSKAKFILRNMSVNKYSMLHQFHKWYAMKLNIPGFDEKTQGNFKKFLKFSDDEGLKSLDLGEIISLKEAIARDVEAINFVVGVAKGTDGCKNAMEKLVAGGASV